ncbi:MAG TPA: threonine ammonia-lyase [Fervidicoccus fontis]|uniref:threonine ammonia-lyase n=1 Tax=Fervidicoccus fontis TaxID=683846 RepID=A0A7C2YJW0_9CREN|nr:threonine ammonia-lyase [Fervidicoccus fontis]
MIRELERLIDEADRVLDGKIHRTPLDYSATFSRMGRCSAYLKLENMQKTGSFKVRGALFKITRNIEVARAKGVVAASSGNHAQGVAYSSSVMGVRATIVMPEVTPPFKVNATKSYGANVVLHGRVYDESYARALEISEQTGAMLVHPFNDLEVMAGQGTIGLEILRQLPEVEEVVVPIGGGGLISGIATALKSKKRGARVIGVEPKGDPKYRVSREKGEIVKIDPMPSLADGVITKSVGDLTFEIMNEVVDDVVTVDEDSIARAIYLLMERTKLVVEGAGALPLAALLEGRVGGNEKKTVLVLSGGNIDLTTLYRIILRGLSAEGRIAEIGVILKDFPGELKRALEVISNNRGNILEIKHDRLGINIPPGYAKAELIVELPSSDLEQKIKDELRAMGFQIIQ